MLVLARNRDQSIVLCDGETGAVFAHITVTEVGQGRCKLGFAAPPSVQILRAEIAERIESERAAIYLEDMEAGL